MSFVCYTTEHSSSHDDHLYQNNQQWSMKQPLNLEQDTSIDSFTDLLMSSSLNTMFQDVLYNLPKDESVDLAVDSDQCVEEPQDCVNGADLCYPSQHNGHYYSSASPDFGMVLTPDLTHLNPRFSPEPICPESSLIRSISRGQHSVARKLIMSPEDFISPEHSVNSFQFEYSTTTTSRKRKSSVLEDKSTEVISDHSSNSETSGEFSNNSNIDHDAISFNMNYIQPDNKRQRLDGCQDVFVSHEKGEDSLLLRSSSLDDDSSNDNTPESASSPKRSPSSEPEYLHVLSLPKPDPEMCQPPVQDICQPQKDTSKPATNSKAGKPSESHVELISRAIMKSSEQRLVLADIYQYIYDNYPYFQTAPRGWRNTVRYNLSTNECFIKNGRAPSGRGFYWAIHPACVEDIQKGEFNRRLARQRVQYATSVGISIHQVGLQDLNKNPLDGLLPPAVSSEILNPTHIEYLSLHNHATPAGISLNDIMLPSPVPCRTNIMTPYSTTDNYTSTAPHITQSLCMTSQQVPVSSQTYHTVDPGMYYQQQK